MAVCAEIRVDRHRVRAEAGRTAATAWRAAVVPMSPRLASVDHREVGRQARPDPFEGGDAGRPERLEEREVGLDGRRVRAGGVDESAANASTPPTSAANPAGSAAGSGSRPRHRTLPTAADRAASRSR